MTQRIQRGRFCHEAIEIDVDPDLHRLCSDHDQSFAESAGRTKLPGTDGVKVGRVLGTID